MTMRNYLLIVGVALFASCLPAPVAAATYALPPAADARVISYGGLELANYATDILSVYHAQGNVQRTFLQFDLSGVVLAPNECVQSAVLTLTASTSWGPSNGKPMEIYRVASSWDEQSLTWRQRSTGSPWTRFGGDVEGYNGGAYAVSTSSPANNEAVNWDVTRLVQEWVDGLTPNHGMLLRSYEGNLLTFVQAESSAVGSRPVLTVVTGIGVPLLKCSPDHGAGQAILSWRGDGAVLQERASATTGDWADSALPISVEGDRSVVKYSAAAGARFFRLRSKP